MIDFSDIGPIVFERSSKAKKINISIKSVDIVRVAVPSGVAIEEAHNFVRLKAGWIRKSLDRIGDKVNLNYKIKDIDKEYAKKNIINRLNYLSNLHKFKYKSVSIRNQKTRWGSCSSLNKIDLSSSRVAGLRYSSRACSYKN